jgi:hypothetical protein
MYFTFPFGKDGRHGIPESHADRNECQHESQQKLILARLEARIETSRQTDQKERKAERMAD